ncbi:MULTISPECIES: hypothetical protein [Prosthecochloris]|uniref:Uncharacterized protein n=1 Tax=Prosthecochloris vibrioformis TaxID=1098 RepID=A0A5C4S1I9_PROVB|nr:MULTISPECIES: hypothetical protein [Prosthecochloris]ANT64475.1 hypothetical protein Ptc2401_00680 [Prosthecochloris sp. CIB 2401]TNJ37320.1 hypothetical protein FGF68_03615 [Prosthecochloris vibrioformis]
MQQVFEYPMTYPGWWLDSYYIFSWAFGMLMLAAGWAYFFRYGKFSYGIDLGCLWKSTLLLILTTVSLGVPNYYNVRFEAEHGREGDKVMLSEDGMIYIYRNGSQKLFGKDDIRRVYQEEVTFNPPPRIYVVAEQGGARDSVFVTERFPRYDELLQSVADIAGLQVERP